MQLRDEGQQVAGEVDSAALMAGTLERSSTGGHEAGVLVGDDEPHPAGRVRLPDDSATALLCVERDPEACHRSLLAERLQTEHGLLVTDLRPPTRGRVR